MASWPGWLYFLLVLLIQPSLQAGLDPSAITALPACTLKCAANVDISSLIIDPYAFCHDEALVNNIGQCTFKTCTVRESLQAQRVFATFCKPPHRDDSNALFILGIVFLVLTGVSTCIRVLTRLPPFSVRVGPDDYFLLAGMIALIPGAILTMKLAKAGIGRDLWTLTDDDVDRVIKLMYISSIPYIFILGVTKLSILFFCHRIFGAINSFRWASFVTMIACVAYLLTFLPLQIFQCWPIPYNWEFWSGETSGRCINRQAYIWSASLMNIVLDLAVLIIPIPHLLQLKLSFKKKVQIISMFCVGFFITIVSVVRLQSLMQFTNSNNFTYDRLPACYWSATEIGVSIICACMPSLQLFLRRAVPSVFGETTRKSEYRRSGYQDMPSAQTPNLNKGNELSLTEILRDTAEDNNDDKTTSISRTNSDLTKDNLTVTETKIPEQRSVSFSNLPPLEPWNPTAIELSLPSPPPPIPLPPIPQKRESGDIV